MGEGVCVGALVRVGVGVREGACVRVGVGVREGAWVRVGVCVGVTVRVEVEVRVGEGVILGTAVGGWPSTVKRPEVFHDKPMNICTSYSPGSHKYGSGSQSL